MANKLHHYSILSVFTLGCILARTSHDIRMQCDAITCVFRFINARRRIVQPMIDQSNRAGRPTQRHWLDWHLLASL